MNDEPTPLSQETELPAGFIRLTEFHHGWTQRTTDPENPSKVTFVERPAAEGQTVVQASSVVRVSKFGDERTTVFLESAHSFQVTETYAEVLFAIRSALCTP